MRNGQVSDAPFSLNGTNISECSSYVYLGREVNMANYLAPELSRRERAAWRAFKSVEEVAKKTRTPSRRKRAAWGAFKSVEEVAKKTKNVRLPASLFDSTVLPALTCASETWAIRKQDEHAISVESRLGELLRASKKSRRRRRTSDSVPTYHSTVLPALAYASETWAIRKQDEHAISVAQREIERTMLEVTRLTQKSVEQKLTVILDFARMVLHSTRRASQKVT
ncbi:unnamed protein product [Heligmosomoides polygyrus]|uniref:Uncharacterized protein n=1 Tax=Heligmosomoides polygyrus TaxID=6339 RepID=A0A183F5M9_HELPZ|nr:unnamed protein product [Heligmosomoides polygyrus]